MVMLYGCHFNFTTITLSEPGKKPIIEFTTLFSKMMLSPFFALLLLNISLSFFILPFFVHNTFGIPIIFEFILFISLIALSSLPDLYKVLTFQVSMFKIAP